MVRFLLISAILLEGASGFVLNNICNHWTDDISMKVITGVSRNSKLIQARGSSISSLVSRLIENATSIRENIVDTFSCEGRVYGYYADQDNDCQIFHICVPMQQLFPDMFCAEDIIHFSFICPAQTIFNQEAMVCDWTDHAFPCSAADHLYDKNNLLFVVPAEDVQRESSSVVTTTPAPSRSSMCCSNRKQTAPAASTVPPDIATDERGRSVQQYHVTSSGPVQVQAEASNPHQIQINPKQPDVTYHTVSETEQVQYEYKQQIVAHPTVDNVDHFQSQHKQPEHTHTEYATTEELTENMNHSNLDDFLITITLPSEDQTIITTPLNNTLTTPTSPVPEPFDIPESTTLFPINQLSSEDNETEQSTSYYPKMPTATNIQPVDPETVAFNNADSPDSTVSNLPEFTVFETTTSLRSAKGSSSSEKGAISDTDYVTEYIWSHESTSQTSLSDLSAVGQNQGQLQQGSPDYKSFMPKQTAQPLTHALSRIPRVPDYTLFYSSNSGNFYRFLDY